MKKLILLMFFLFFCINASGNNVLDEQKEIKIFIRKMYSITTLVFEYSEYNKKFQPEKSCDLYKKFFLASLVLKREDSLPGCRINFQRFPDGDSSTLGLFGGIPPARPEFTMINVDNHNANARILLKADGNVHSEIVFFMIKTSDGWRIENALSLRSVPVNPNKDNSFVACVSLDYIVPASPEQRKYEPKYCQ